MKTIILSAASALLLLGSCAQKQEYTDFTISGTIPGLKAGDKVELRANDREFGMRVDTVAGDGVFVIKGVAAQPVIAEIRIYPVENEKSIGYAFPLMVENGIITVEAAHLDSLPPSWYTGGEGKMKERNVTVNGGRAQSEFAEYQEFMFPYELAVKEGHKNLYWGEDKSPEANAAAQEAYTNAERELAAKNDEFVNDHPAYSVSTIILGQKVSEPFTYTDDELTEIAAMLAACPDTARVTAINASIDKARKFTRGARYSDFELTAPNGKKEQFSSHFGNGKVKFVDFWASWCGPCRAAIPHVKELYAQYPEGLEIISVSVDQDDKAWERAMKDENMPWQQFIAKDGAVDVLRSAYQLSGIPYLLIFDDNGSIVYAGHNPQEVSDLLATMIK
ncbi:MAG: AhpC/TSA family protein [Muribaculaceae bacterium]|nr:AhpC/TSA family protein [Muribaculaceae bacterium]